VKKNNSHFLNFILLAVIIFSNYSFGKEFQKLFEITSPTNNVSNIDIVISKSFNDLVYRLTGDNNFRTIKKIAPDMKTKKDFLVSYEPITINNEPFLLSKFNKDSLIKKLNELEIPVIGYNRPITMMLIKIDDGKYPPYILNTSSNKLLDENIKFILNKISNKRGIFFELPVFDLNDLEELNNLTIFDSEKEIILSNYEYDYELNLQISQPFINQWIITGDLNLDKFINLDLILLDFEENLNIITDNFLTDFLTPNISNSINISVSNINSYNDFVSFQEALNRLISIKDAKMTSYTNSLLSYTFIIKGDSESFVKEVNANLDLQVINIEEDSISIELNN
tara:strand:- start:1278 stop:2294 length:1017 start_codon:yes stop_codon:yes gene_type:complete